MRRFKSNFLLAAAAIGGALASFFAPAAEAAITCNRTLTADIVAFDMPLMYNRLGAQNINGTMFALRNDVVHLGSNTPIGMDNPVGDVTLRPDKRPRPLVLRMGRGDCLQIKLTNLLAGAANPFSAPDPNISPPVAGEVRSGIPFNLNIDDQVAERKVSLRFSGTELVGSMADDGSNVGTNTSSLVASGDYAIYTIHAPRTGTFVGHSYGATIGSEGLGGNTANGLWAVLTVGPEGSAIYRSQVTREDLDLATTGYNLTTGHPIINYEATYPLEEPWWSEGKAGRPIINMVDGTEVVHSDINAIFAYDADGDFAFDGDGRFPASTYPLESTGKRNPTVPNRLEPYRDFTVAFHDEVATKQAFPLWFEQQPLRHTLHSVRDSFMINYGSGGIGSEIIANRLRVGPMHDCINCAYEEFFLTAYTVGDVGMLVDTPANFGLEDCAPSLVGCEETGPKANFALYPDDPSNVHHGYIGDRTVFNNLHIGPGEQHVFHLHNHQWLFNPSDDNSNYLDAQGLGPGSGYSYDVNFGGAGNRNKTVGDAIFHCHFYPHFAQGMWEMWRVHDVFEQGTELVAQQATVDDGSGGGVAGDGTADRRESFVEDMDGLGIGDGTPTATARALPDGEILAGTPIPGVVPLPGKPMAPMPQAEVQVVANSNTVCVNDPGVAPAFPGLVAKVGGVCPTGAMARATGSLADVTRPAGSDVGNPGYPFWIAGIEHSVGQRPTTPPLDMITRSKAESLQANGADGIPGSGDEALWQHPGFAADAIDGWDGGLPRYTLDGYSTGGEAIVAITRLDMSKEILKAKPFFFPEEGTDLEHAAMTFHSQRCHDTSYPDGMSADCDDTGPGGTGGFIANGALPVPGAPYNEPCVDDRGVLLAGDDGMFFGGGYSYDMYDTGAMSVTGSSPFSAVTPRVYKAANVQLDAVFNKLGYHYPQQRIIALWQDVVPTITKDRPPEPFVLRMNTFDCTQYVHSNVVPKAYELDDYQVRTPTDIIGQHIHLPKWDLTSADGSANGWNYEDGTLSPGMVVEVIEAINRWQDEETPVTLDIEGNPVVNSYGDAITDDPANHLHPLVHHSMGAPSVLNQAEWLGARSTLQRWFADPVVNVQGVDRGLGIIFTHDHYGPSTHQQIGLYATVLIEPAGSRWVHNETGQQLGSSPDGTPAEPGRIDGGPTSWQAAILTGADGFGSDYSQNVKAELVENYREFYFEYSDFQHAYQPGVYVGIDEYNMPVDDYHFAKGMPLAPGLWLNASQITMPGFGNATTDSFRDAIQPSFRQQAEPTVDGYGPPGFEDFPTDIWVFPPFCPGGVDRPCPEAISADDPGMYVVNYRNESVAARIFDPNRDDCPDDSDPSDGIAEHGGCQAKGRAGDLAYALHSGTGRVIPELNDVLGLAPASYAGGGCTGVFCPPINDLAALDGGDPFTPMLRTFEGDRVHVKVQAGAHEEEHTKLFHGLKWLQAGSGFGEAKNSGWRNAQPGGISEQFAFRMPVLPDKNQTGGVADYAYTVSNSFDGWVSGTWGVLRSYQSGAPGNLFELPNNPGGKVQITNAKDFNGVCPKSAPVRQYDITAVLAEDVLPAPPAAAGVTIQDFYPDSHEGRSPEGPGTLVYNSRTDLVAGTIEARGGVGPLHDPTAILYVHTADLEADYPGGTGNGANFVPDDPRCWKMEGKAKYDPTLSTCPVQLKPGVAVEPLVIRANAGECIEVTLRNKLLQQAVTDDAYAYPIYNDLGKPVFEDEGYQKHLEKGLNADTDGDYLGDAAVSYYDVHFDRMPDLATGNATGAIVRRDDVTNDAIQGMSSFQTNLMAPSACVGLHPSLVEYDVTRDDGTAVGQNNPSQNIVCPNQTQNPTYRWYAGHIEPVLVSTGRGGKRFEYQPTPIEFGGFNIMAADKLEQPQKGAVAAGVIYPTDSYWTVDDGTTTEATVNETFRDFTIVAQKGASMFYADSFPVENILGEGEFGVAEDAQDMGQMAINYGVEPMWYRFGVNPTAAAGNAAAAGTLGAVDAELAYSNGLVGEDPQTAVFNVTAGDPFRQHVLMPSGPGRGSTFDLHGHVWQRDPYLCPGSADLGIPGKCEMGIGVPGTANTTDEVGSKALGENPIGFGLGGIESWFPGEHYEIVIPEAGGGNHVYGDYLFRDRMGLGNSQGLWGIVRVE